MAYYDPTPQGLVNHEDDAEHERIWQEYFLKRIRSLPDMSILPNYDPDEYERQARESYDYFFRTLLKTYTIEQIGRPFLPVPPERMPPPHPHPPAHHLSSLDDEKPPKQGRPTIPKPPAFSIPTYLLSGGDSSLDDEKPPIQDHPTLPKPPAFSRPTYLSGGESSLDDEKPPIQDHPTLPKPPAFSSMSLQSG